MAKKLNERSVLQIASEALPFAKTGGLADVLGALPPALARLGWDVTVVTPRYHGVTAGSLVERFPVTVGGFVADAGFFEAPLPDSARAILIDCPDLYDRDALYGVDNSRSIVTEASSEPRVCWPDLLFERVPAGIKAVRLNTPIPMTISATRISIIVKPRVSRRGPRRECRRSECCPVRCGFGAFMGGRPFRWRRR